MRDYEYSDLYFDAHLDKQMRIEVLGAGITIDNSMIELDAFELDEMLCSEQELIFGSCEANCVKFTARDMPGSIVGKTIRITETVDGNTDVPFQYGIYKVYNDVPSSDRTKREITAYDAMYDIITADVKSWYAGLTFPMALRQFRDSFFAHFGITQKETALVNDAMTVNKTLVAEQTDPDSTITAESAISGKTVIEAICEINGVFGNINRDGEFEYVELKEIVHPLYPANDLYPSDDLFPRDPNTISMTGHYITFDYEDFQTKQITQLEIRPADDSAGAVVGMSGNTYAISGNFLVSDKMGTELEAIAANTLSIIRKASYTPLKSSEIVGNPCIELGDPIRFNTTREIIESYVLQRTLTGIQNKRDSIVSPGTETYKQNPNSIRDQISSVERRTNKLERTADHTLSEIKAVDSKVDTLDGSVRESVSELESKIEQTASSITSEVSQKVTETNNSIALVNEKVDDLSSSVEMSVRELDSKIEQTATSITSEVNERVTQINQDISDVDNKVNDLNTSVGTSVSELNSKIEQTASSITSEVNKKVTQINSDISVVDGKVGAVDGKVDDLAASVAESATDLSSRIEQTAERIQTEVSNRQNADNEMSSKIEQAAHSISLSATGGNQTVGIKISLLDEKGNIIDSAEDANIKITGAVRFEDLENAGGTVINGENIKTGHISCDLLDGGKIKGQTIVGGYLNGVNILSQKFYTDSNDEEVYYGPFLRLKDGILSGGNNDTEYGSILFNKEFWDDQTPDIRSYGLIIDADYIALKPAAHLAIFDGANPDGSDHYLYGRTGTIEYLKGVDANWTYYNEVKTLKQALWTYYTNVTFVTYVDFNSKTVKTQTLQNIVADLNIETGVLEKVVGELSIKNTSESINFSHGILT